MIYQVRYDGQLVLCQTENKKVVSHTICDYLEKNGGQFSNFCIYCYEDEQRLKDANSQRTYSIEGWAAMQALEMHSVWSPI